MASPVRLDDGVANLQRFIAHLVSSTGALEKSSEHFKQEGHRFGEMEDEAADHGGALNDELEELGSALDSGLEGAEDALSELTQAAGEAQGTAGEARRELEEAASSLEEEADKTVADLTDANARLTAEGFEALGRTLDEAQRDLQTEGEHSTQAFDHFENAAGTAQTGAEAAWDAAEAALDEAATELGQDGSAFEAAAHECVQGFDSAAGEFEQHCTDLASEVDAIYDLLDGAVVQEGQEWDQGVESLARDAAAWLEGAAEERLDQPASAVEEEALSALEQEYAALATVLEGGRATAGELEPLAGDLAACQGVVAQVDELMKALAG
jgi:chromosome segregation ATPase